MTTDHLLALSFVPNLSRVGLADRLRSEDPTLADSATRFLDVARRARDAAAAHGISAVAWNEANYPASLLTLPDFPPVLWCRGDLSALDRPTVAIVGSRAASATALETATGLGADLAARGVTVVSGLARGVDSAAHRGALAHGVTVAILGSGLDVIYPREHAALAVQIAESGAIVGEYPPGTLPYPFHFPQRNRLISGLSRAVVIVEAAEGSGSLITATCALEQGREVMAVPGNVLSGRNRGAHALIRDGAKIVEGADDILDELGISQEPADHGAGHPTDAVTTTSRDPVLRVMDCGHAYDLDALSAASGLDGTRLLPRLLDLELRRLIRRVGGGRFMRSA